MVVSLLVKQMAFEARVLGLSIVPLLSAPLLIVLSLSFLLCKVWLIVCLPRVPVSNED